MYALCDINGILPDRRANIRSATQISTQPFLVRIYRYLLSGPQIRARVSARNKDLVNEDEVSFSLLDVDVLLDAPRRSGSCTAFDLY